MALNLWETPRIPRMAQGVVGVLRMHCPSRPSKGKILGTQNDNYEDHKANSVGSHEQTKLRSRESFCSVRETSSMSEHVSHQNGPVLKQKRNMRYNRCSPCPVGTNASQENDSGRKRQSKRGNGIEKIKQPKNTKRSFLSACCGQSPEGLCSTGLHSSYSYSMASSLSDESETRTQKSHSKSWSFSSLSTPGSRDQPLASSLPKSYLNEDNPVGNANFPCSLEDHSEHVELLKNGGTAEIHTVNSDTSMTVAVERTVTSVAEKPYSIDNDQNPGSDGQDVGAVALSSYTTKISSCRPLEESLDASQKVSFENSQPLDDTDVLMKEDKVATTDNVQMPRVSSSNSGRYLSLSSEDIVMVLNHYGIEVTKEFERQAPAKEFFGCARMGPWPIIYYWRLRKGPVSFDNYTRRVLQNKEYGMIDKFVRGSRIWGQLKDLSD